MTIVFWAIVVFGTLSATNGTIELNKMCKKEVEEGNAQCPKCEGKGKINGKECDHCEGKGWHPKESYSKKMKESNLFSADELAAIEIALANHKREELKPVVNRSVWAMPLMRTQLPQQIKFGSGRNF